MEVEEVKLQVAGEGGQQQRIQWREVTVVRSTVISGIILQVRVRRAGGGGHGHHLRAEG